MPDLTAIIGLVVGFLVFGVFGLYIGNAIIAVANTSQTDSLPLPSPDPQSGFMDIFLGLGKVLVIVSVASIIIVLLRQMAGGGFGDEDRQETSDTSQPPEPQLQAHNVRQWRTTSSAPAQSTTSAVPDRQPVTGFASSPQHTYSNPFTEEPPHLPENHYHNRFEAILEDEEELGV